MIVTEIFQIAGLVVCDSHIAEDQQIRGENFLQAREFGYRQVFGDLGQEEESLEQLVEPLEVGFAFFVGEFYSENGLVLVQCNKALHEDPASFFLDRERVDLEQWLVEPRYFFDCSAPAIGHIFRVDKCRL